MGNTTSNEEDSRIKSKSRRSSQRSTRFDSTSSACSTHAGTWDQGVLESHEGKQHNSCQHHGILNRLKNKTSARRSRSNTDSKNCPRLDILSKDNNNSLDDLEQSTSPSSIYSSPHSIHNNDLDLIDKYTDSQMTLLNNNNHNNQSLVGSTFYSNHSTTSIHSTATTVTTSDTKHHHHRDHSNGSIPENDSYKSYSSELMLKELYMLSETSPERRRDRDRRLRLHYLLKRIWGSNYKIPLKNPTLIVDWCCATAVWDVELAFEFPNAKVVGIDYESVTVSSLTDTVKNFSFHNALIHEGQSGLEKLDDNTVDYIMMRDVWLVNSPACKWTKILTDVHRILKPGGYIEIYEQDTNFKSMGPNLTIMDRWSDRFFEAIKLDRNTNTQLGSFLRNAGLINVKEESIELPIGEWPETKELRETGYLQKDLVERRFRENKRWYCQFNHTSDKEYTNTMIKAIDECDQYRTTVRSFYYSAQKPCNS